MNYGTVQPQAVLTVEAGAERHPAALHPTLPNKKLQNIMDVLGGGIELFKTMSDGLVFRPPSEEQELGLISL